MKPDTERFEQFKKAMWDRGYYEPLRLGIKCYRYATMLRTHGELVTARKLIDRRPPPGTFDELKRLDWLSLTVEAIIIDFPEFFTADQVQEAVRRLEPLGYAPAMMH